MEVLRRITSTMKNRVGECDNTTDAKLSRCAMIYSGPGLSTIPGRNYPNEYHAAIDPYLHRAHFANGHRLSARNDRPARERYATQPAYRPTS